MTSFEERIQTESTSWVTDGLITSEQRELIIARHPLATPQHNRFLGILAGIGGALLVVGISLVIKANWDQIGDWLKIGGLVALLVGSYTLGWRLKLSPGRYPKTGDACLMIGSVLFLLGIALVSQIYHINSRPANGVLLWWAGIAFTPWITRARGVQLVSLIAGTTWLGMEFGAPDSWLRLVVSPDRWYSLDFYLMMSAFFLVGLTIALFGRGLRGMSPSGAENATVASEHFSGFARLHETLGILIVCWALYTLGFTWTVHNWSVTTENAARWQPVTVLLALIVGAGAFAWRGGLAEWKPLFWSAIPAFVAVGAHLAGVELRDSGWLWGGLSCLALFLLNLGMVRVGLATGRESWINIGMAGIALNVITRYFLLFGTMLEGGVFFIVTGLVVLALGWFLERKRRTLVGTVRAEGLS
jgi:uncharacterized membrane protein